jgi:hypothetical protein
MRHDRRKALDQIAPLCPLGREQVSRPLDYELRGVERKLFQQEETFYPRKAYWGSSPGERVSSQRLRTMKVGDANGM